MRKKLLMDIIILGVKSEKTRGKLISQSKLDLRKAIAICRADEAAGEQIRVMNPKAREEMHQMTGKESGIRNQEYFIEPNGQQH